MRTNVGVYTKETMEVKSRLVASMTDDHRLGSSDTCRRKYLQSNPAYPRICTDTLMLAMNTLHSAFSMADNEQPLIGRDYAGVTQASEVPANAAS